jgi:fumarate reductase subunit C
MSSNDPRRPYVRPTSGWWRKNPFFVYYMARELTAFVVAAYGLVVLAGLLCLAGGEASWNGWLAVMRHPVSLVLHVLALIALVFHSWTWFEIMPKTMPPVVIAGKALPPKAITTGGVVAFIVVTAVLYVVFWSLQ